jgi:hypothetical protein
MAHQIFKLPKNTQIDSSVRVTPGAKAYFYTTLTTTPQDTYTTSALSVAHPNPVVADANGVFPAIYLNPSLVYKLTLTTSADVLIYTVDPVNDQLLSALSVGKVLYPLSTREQAGGLVEADIEDFSKEYGDVRRYGADPDALDNTAAIQNAIDGAGIAGEVIFPAIGTFTCTGSLTGMNFQTWRGKSYELGAGPSQASLLCTKTSGTFITAGANPRFENMRFLGVLSYTDATGATAGSTCIAIKLTDSGLTMNNCTFQQQFFCWETSSSGVFYVRLKGLEVTRCAVFVNMLEDSFNMELDGCVFRLCNTVTSSNATKFAHNLKVIGGSFETWAGGLFNYVRTASFFGTYFENDIAGGFGFNSNLAFTADTSISLFGCLVFLNNLNTFVNYDGETDCSFTSIGNTIACSVNSGQNQYYFDAPDSGGNIVMMDAKLDDRGVGTFHGVYVNDSTKVRNQLIVWPQGHANAGQVWMPGGTPVHQTSTTAALEAIGNAINTANKFEGKTLRNTTSNKLVIAQGSAAASTWISCDGATTHTPV